MGGGRGVLCLHTKRKEANRKEKKTLHILGAYTPLCLVRFFFQFGVNLIRKKLYSNDGIFRGVTSIKKFFLFF